MSEERLPTTPLIPCLVLLFLRKCFASCFAISRSATIISRFRIQFLHPILSFFHHSRVPHHDPIWEAPLTFPIARITSQTFLSSTKTSSSIERWTVTLAGYPNQFSTHVQKFPWPSWILFSPRGPHFLRNFILYCTDNSPAFICGLRTIMSVSHFLPWWPFPHTVAISNCPTLSAFKSQRHSSLDKCVHFSTTKSPNTGFVAMELTFHQIKHLHGWHVPASFLVSVRLHFCHTSTTQS